MWEWLVGNPGTLIRELDTLEYCLITEGVLAVSGGGAACFEVEDLSNHFNPALEEEEK